MTASRFTLTGLSLLEGAAAFPADDLLGIWELNASQTIAFAAPAEDAAATSLPAGEDEPGLISGLSSRRREARLSLSLMRVWPQQGSVRRISKQPRSGYPICRWGRPTVPK